MNKLIKTALGLIAFSFIALPASALIINPSDNEGTSNTTGNCEPGCINGELGTALTGGALYKAEFPSGEEGPYADDYWTDWVQTDSEGEPNGADINWSGPDAIECPNCYLAVKDGNNNPNHYFFELSTWDGMETLELRDFWKDTQGSISHVSLWSADGGTNVPEPGTTALLVSGIMGLVLSRRRIHRG